MTESTTAVSHRTADDAHGAQAAHAAHDHKPTGWRRWVFATNHKDIGTMYLVFSGLMFFIGGSMAMVIRAELFSPGMQLVDPTFFNSMTTMHALFMIFGAVMPAWTGLANEQSAEGVNKAAATADTAAPAAATTTPPQG